jgi:hypothetical protein
MTGEPPTGTIGTPGPGRPKGTPKTGGRQQGTPNKIAANIKAGILAAYEQAGGEEYLLQVAKTDPRTFCTLLGKVLPTQIEASDTGGFEQMIATFMQGIGSTTGLPKDHPSFSKVEGE